MLSRKILSFIGILIALVLIVYWLPKSHSPLPLGEIRAALDIGSGATNLKIARVDPLTSKITEVLLDQSLPVAYQKELELSSDHTFNQQVRKEGIQAIKSLKEVANRYQAKKIVAVATEAFRQARNAPAFAQEIETQTGIPIRIINQEEEGILAFRGALALTAVDPQQTVVWDIGGGSMQLTTLTDSGTYLVEKGKTASAPFKNFIIQKIQGYSLEAISTPNPLSLNQMQQTIDQAKSLASKTDSFIQQKLIQPTTHVLAVGNLFNYSVRPLVNNQIVKQKELQKAVFQLANKTDAELPGKTFADVAVSNPLMILGYMEELQIPQVEVVNVNNTDGALTYPLYWQ